MHLNASFCSVEQHHKGDCITCGMENTLIMEFIFTHHDVAQCLFLDSI